MYIAHYDKSNKEAQDLKTHLDNVAYLAGEFGKKLGLEKTMYLLGKIHDGGKLCDDFQKKMLLVTEGKEVEADAIHFDHGVYGAKVIFSLYGNKPGIQRAAAEIIALIVGYHHGGLPDAVTEDNKVTLLHRLDKIEEGELQDFIIKYKEIDSSFDINDYFQASCKEIETAYSNIKARFEKDADFTFGLLIKMLYSMLVDADRYDCALFEGQTYDIKGISLRLQKEAVNWSEYAEQLEEHLEGFKDMTGLSAGERKVNRIRQKISDECLAAAKWIKGILWLTVPTGGGKTLASLRFALNHAIEHNMDRIIYVLPYTTIIEQNAHVAREAIRCAKVLEHHSNVVVDDGEKETYKLLTARWSEPVIFTTMVQFLNSFFNGGTQDIRRIHNLTNSVIIFDEIQTLPIKCISLFNSAINFLTRVCDATVVLCSATQPTLGEVKTPIVDIGAQDGEVGSREIIEDMAEKYKELERVEVIDNTCDGSITYAEAGDFVLEKKREFNSVLVVVNKVASAEQIYNEVCEKAGESVKLFYLTSNLCPAHRKNVIDEMKTSLNNGESVMCISTQLIEAGVDISFDANIRCLAGLDSVAQAAGRVNRHGKDIRGKCFIIKISEESLSRLPEIKAGATHCGEVLYDYKVEPKNFDNSLLSPESVTEYYRKYYNDGEIIKKMYYPIGDGSLSIYKWLCSKRANQRGYTDITGERYPLLYSYNFKSAGKNFRVIDTGSHTVVTTYEGGKKIVEEMNNDNTNIKLNEKLTMLEKMKPYCVSINQTFFKTIGAEKGIVFNETFGVYILSEDYYDDCKGVTTEKKMKVLSY